MRTHTTIWGIGMMLDAVVRVVMAYTLPVDVVPLLNAVQYGVLIVLLLVISIAYSRAVGLVPGSPDYPAKPTPDASEPRDGADEPVGTDDTEGPAR